MPRPIHLMSALVFAAGSAAAATPVLALKGAEMVPMATITLATARATALAARPGVITDQELEKEGGGSGLRYSFDIKNNRTTFEVGIDARTGKVLESGVEGANPD